MTKTTEVASRDRAGTTGGPSSTAADRESAGEVRQSRRQATEMMTYAEAATFLNVPVGTLYDWVHRKVVPHVRLGPRLVRFPLSALGRWLEARTIPEKGSPEHRERTK